MAKRRGRTRARSGKQDAGGIRMASRNGTVGDSAGASVVPRVLLGMVNGVEIVAAGALQFTREVLLTAVSGAANIGGEALTAAGAGARGVVSAASRMVGDIAGTAQGTFQEVLNNARHLRPGAARMALWRPAASVAGGPSATTQTPSTKALSPRRRGRRARPAVRPARTSVAA